MKVRALPGALWLAAFAPICSATDPFNVAEVAAAKCAFCPDMVKVPAGEFDMGSPAHDFDGSQYERPVHRVRINAFEIARYAVTFEQWDACAKQGGCSHRPLDHAQALRRPRDPRRKDSLGAELLRFGLDADAARGLARGRSRSKSLKRSSPASRPSPFAACPEQEPTIRSRAPVLAFGARKTIDTEVLRLSSILGQDLHAAIGLA